MMALEDIKFEASWAPVEEDVRKMMEGAQGRYTPNREDAIEEVEELLRLVEYAAKNRVGTSELWNTLRLNVALALGAADKIIESKP